MLSAHYFVFVISAIEINLYSLYSFLQFNTTTDHCFERLLGRCISRLRDGRRFMLGINLKVSFNLIDFSLKE